MFSNQSRIEKLTTEVLINITTFLDVASIFQLSTSAKAFSHLIKDELVFRQLVERDFHVHTKEPDQTWVQLYQQLQRSQEQVTHNTEQDTTSPKEPEPVLVEEEQETVQDIKENTTLVEQEETMPMVETPLSNGLHSEVCPHLNQVSDTVNEIKRILYKSSNPSLCDLCLSKTASFLNMSDNCHYEGKQEVLLLGPK